MNALNARAIGLDRKLAKNTDKTSLLLHKRKDNGV